MERPSPPKRPRVEAEARLPTATHDPDDQHDQDDDQEQVQHEDRAEMEQPRSLAWPAVPMQYDYEGGAFFYKRECYDEYYTLLERVVLARKRIVTITGTPGIGKSVFYGYFFDRFRREHPEVCVIAASFEKGTPRNVAVYKGDGGELINFEPTPAADPAVFMRNAREEGYVAHRQVVFLCDGPPDAFRGDCCVVFSSPDEELLRVTRKYRQTYYMPLWTREELYEAAAVLDLPIGQLPYAQASESDSEGGQDVARRLRERDHKREAEIDRRFDIFGGAARNCLHPDPSAVEISVNELDDAIKTVRSVAELEALLTGKTVPSVRHCLVYFRPRDDNRAIKTTELASSYVVKGLTDQVLALSLADRERFRGMIRGIPEAASLRGSIFERETHTKLVEGCVLALRRLGPVVVSGGDPSPGRDVETVTITPTPKPIVSFRAVTKAMLARGPYHQPESRIWESIDSFYLPTMTPTAAVPSTLCAQDVTAWNAQSANRLLLFQITVSKTHDVNVAGILHVLRQLDLLQSVADHPERAALVFVVPKDIVDDFKRQQIVVPTDVSDSSLITDIKGIGGSTVVDLAPYKIVTVGDLREKIASFDEGKFSVEQQHTKSWARARRCATNHGLFIDGAELGAAIATIPQYVCSWEANT